MKQYVWFILLTILFAQGVFAQSDVAMHRVLAVAGTIESGKVYQLQMTGDMDDSNSWSDIQSPYLASEDGTNRWYYHPEAGTNEFFRVVERDSEPRDYVDPFVAPYYETIPVEDIGSLSYFHTSMLAQATFIFNPITEVKGFSITYAATDAHGVTQNVSGLLVTPSPKAYYGALPMLSIQHPTQVERMGSPSFMSIRDDEYAWIIAYLIASTGYIVVMPDYPGMGVNMDVHPYCQASLSHSAVQCIYTSTNMLPYKTTNILWNGELYLMGYSEGGYITMMTSRDIQENHTNLDLRATACLDGPYALSDTMRKTILTADQTYNSPYFLPYTINGYDFVYSNDFAFFRCITNSIPADPSFASNLLQLMNGNYTSANISDKMEEVPGYSGPSSILTPDCLQDMQDTNSFIVLTMASNNAYRAWIPEKPLRMYHNVIDDLVPYGNATNAYGSFIAQGAETSVVQLVDYVFFIPDMGSIHAGSFPVAMVKGYLWLDEIAYPARH